MHTKTPHKSYNIINLEQAILQTVNSDKAKVSFPDYKHGHLTTNAFILKSKLEQSSPAELFERDKNKLLNIQGVKSVDFASGFCNIKFNDEFIKNNLHDIVHNHKKYGAQDLGKGSKVNIEYISANPTGPMHLGHLRGLYADVLANLLEFFNYKVTREYLINDSGNQVRILGESVRYQYCIAHGIEMAEPPEMYRGKEVQMIAAGLIEPNLNDAQYFEQIALESMMNFIKEDIKLLNVHFDVWRRESDLFKEGLTDRAVQILESKGAIADGVLGEIKGKKGSASNEIIKLYKNEKAVTKPNGVYTYFGSDLGYIYDKIQRGFDLIVYCVGSDQGNHMEYIADAAKELNPDAKVQIIYFQSVDMIKDGVHMKFSKRGGIAVRPSELDLPDINILRYMIVSKKNDTHFSINIDDMKKIVMSNMFYYVQYAYARACSILRSQDENGNKDHIDIKELNLLHLTPSMYELSYRLCKYPKELEIALNGVNHLINYVEELAEIFHKIWSEGNENPQYRWIVEDKSVLNSRMCLVFAFRNTMLNIMTLLGIKPYEVI